MCVHRNKIRMTREKGGWGGGQGAREERGEMKVELRQAGSMQAVDRPA